MKKDTEALLEEALGKLGSAPAEHRHLYTNVTLLREYFQSFSDEVRQFHEEQGGHFLAEMKESANPILTPHQGNVWPNHALQRSRNQPLLELAYFEKLEASGIFKESFSIIQPLVDEVRRLEAKLESERVEGLKKKADESLAESSTN